MGRIHFAWAMAAVLALAACLGLTATSSQAAPKATKHAVGSSFQDCRDCPVMIVAPAGSFIMGSPPTETGHRDNEAQHKVSFKHAFAIGKFDVTWDQWMDCVRDHACDGYAMEEALRIDFMTGKPFGAAYVDHGRGKRPVVGVSWYDAQMYVGWLNRKAGTDAYRLPSESEFEYAARAGTTTAYPWGDKPDHDYANYGTPDDQPLGPGTGGRDVWAMQTSPVGSFPPNKWGLYDMQGNVYQWIEDCYQPDALKLPIDGSAQEDVGCRTRGFKSNSFESHPQSLRPANRSFPYAPTMRGRNYTSFRVAKTLE